MRLTSIAGISVVMGAVLLGRTISAAGSAPQVVSQPSPNDERFPSNEDTPTPLPPVTGDAERLPATPSVVRLDLQTALDLTLSANPDLIAVRQNLGVSAEAVEVARRLPTSLNPSVSVHLAPWVFQRLPEYGILQLDPLVAVSLQQPIQFGHMTAHRLSAARAAYDRERWIIVQAELQAVVQTYRLHQAAAYRRDKLRVAEELADFNNRLVATLRRQMEANQVPAADVVLAEVEGQATRQGLATAQQDFVVALSELRRQIGWRDDSRPMEPVGGVQLPDASVAGDGETLIQAALAGQPEIHAAQAQVASSRAALCLARAERIPVPSIGPAYERNETGASFYGLAISSPVPVLNMGATLVRQREAEYHRDMVVLEQLRQRTVLQIKTAQVRWNQGLQLVARTNAIQQPIQAQAARMDRLYEAGQTDLVKLLQVRQRLIEAQNTQLDVLWQAAQAYADLLAAVGVTPLIDSLSPSPQGPDAPFPAAALPQP